MLVSTQTWKLQEYYGLERAVEMLIEAGWDAIDISMFKMDDPPFTDDYKEVAARLLEMAKPRGVKFVQAHAPFGGGMEKYTTQLVPLFPRVFEFVSLLGVESIVVHPVQNGVYRGREEELFKNNVEFYRSLAPLAKHYGVKIAIENMWQRNKKGGYIIDDVLAPPEELARMYDELADPEAFTVCLDLGHVALCNREPEDAIRTLGSRIGALHVHDVDYINDLHTIPYLGRVRWSQVIEALADIDYKGEFTMESDAFLAPYEDDFIPTATRFMADTTKYLAERLQKALDEKSN